MSCLSYTEDSPGVICTWICSLFSSTQENKEFQRCLAMETEMTVSQGRKKRGSLCHLCWLCLVWGLKQSDYLCSGFVRQVHNVSEVDIALLILESSCWRENLYWRLSFSSSCSTSVSSVCGFPESVIFLMSLSWTIILSVVLISIVGCDSTEDLKNIIKKSVQLHDTRHQNLQHPISTKYCV